MKPANRTTPSKSNRNLPPAAGRARQAERQHQRERAERQVDRNTDVPAEVLGQPAAGDRPEGARQTMNTAAR